MSKLNVMNEKERKKIIMESSRFGGLSLRRQKLRLHKNGAKFPISKVYIDDEVLDPKISYTLILIPELYISKKSFVSLYFFQRKMGPTLFYSYPEENINNSEIEKIGDTMSHVKEEGYFSYQSSSLSTLSYYFEIPSDFARGKKELLMISFIPNLAPTITMGKNFQSICEEFVSDLIQSKDIFKALYTKENNKFPDETQEEIKRNSEQLKTRIIDFYKKFNLLLQE